MTRSIDAITDNLRLSVYLYNIHKKNMNGTNLIIFSPINENIKGRIEKIVVVDSFTSTGEDI